MLTSGYSALNLPKAHLNAINTVNLGMFSKWILSKMRITILILIILTCQLLHGQELKKDTIQDVDLRIAVENFNSMRLHGKLFQAAGIMILATSNHNQKNKIGGLMSSFGFVLDIGASVHFLPLKRRHKKKDYFTNIKDN